MRLFCNLSGDSFAYLDKAQYVIGKYRWFGFVDEFSASDAKLAEVGVCLCARAPVCVCVCV